MEIIMEIMKNILNENPTLKPLKVGDIVEGTIIEKKSNIIYLDLGIYGIGVIYGKEIKRAKEELKKVKVGEKILAKIIDIDNEENLIELSIASASKEIVLEMLRKKREANEKIKIKILGANKGGLLTEISGISGFLPLSQLSVENYSQVEKEQPEKILEKLKKFIGKEMEVKILGILEKEKQVILSEKLAKAEKDFEELEVGKEVEGEISGIFDFGVFVKIGDYFEGIILPSEIESRESLSLGQKIKAKIISIEDKKIYLSLK